MAAKATLILSALALTTACSGGSGSGTVGGGGTPGGGQGAQFVWEDLNADWIGQLVPLAAGVQARNVYLRWVDERLIEAAESGGNEWTTANSSRTFKFTGKGLLTADLKATVGTSRLLITAEMSASLATLTGTFKITDSFGVEVEGSFTLTRSSGTGHFAQGDLTGKWDGLGVNGVGKFRFLKFELDAAGDVVTGLMKHPETQVLIRNYSAGSAHFEFADTSVGRINNVVLTSDQGFTLTFSYLLLDQDGILFAGPGVESDLGFGVAELVPGL